MSSDNSTARQGLKENLPQFIWLVVINGFVGAMAGLERTVIPAFAEERFQITSYLALLTFIAGFGSAKAIANLFTGILGSKFNRKQLLISGWLLALPVPWMMMYASDWGVVVLANVLLGFNQGLAWSSTVIMKIDLVGKKQRGLAMGLNEFAGYISVGLGALLAGYIAAVYSPAEALFIPAIVLSAVGLLLSVFIVRDTAHFAVMENLIYERGTPLKNIWKEVTYAHQNLGPVTLNGFINNFNDGITWGLLPLVIVKTGISMQHSGWLIALYPLTWGLVQLYTGKRGDTHCKKQLITAGMVTQGAGMLLLFFNFNVPLLATGLVLMGVGTALVYPSFLSTVAENTLPKQRLMALSIFRFWRDSGYVAGALLGGLLADFIGIPYTLLFTAGITILAGLYAEYRMCCTNKLVWNSNMCVEVY